MCEEYLIIPQIPDHDTENTTLLLLSDLLSAALFIGLSPIFTLIKHSFKFLLQKPRIKSRYLWHNIQTTNSYILFIDQVC